jgi:RNA polymerase sigma factor (sigma-70 family)
MTDNLDETELIKRITNGDRSAFTIIYSRYLNSLYRYVYLFTKSKDVSDEIIQNLFIKIWEKRQTLVDVNSFKAYVYRSAKNMLLDEIKRSQVQTKVFLAIKPDTEINRDESDANIIYNQYLQIAQDAINLLPEKRKQIVELRIKDDLTLDEIAAQLFISKNVVKKQLYTGMQFIREYLQKYGEMTNVWIAFILFLDNK